MRYYIRFIAEYLLELLIEDEWRLIDGFYKTLYVISNLFLDSEHFHIKTCVF